MTKKLQTNFIAALILIGAIVTMPSFTTLDNPSPQKLIKKMEKAIGGWNKLYKQKDVQFTYNYEYPGMNKKDVSTERYIFEGEHSWAKYSTHQINVMPEAEGEVIQSFVHGKPSVSHDGNIMDTPELKGSTTFLRKANYYWFTMMFKLSDPGVELTSMGTEKIGSIEYQKVQVEFNASTVGKKVNDTYILYLNPKTNLVDQFYFSLPAAGVDQPVILMKVEYEKINGLMIPSKRDIFQPNKEGQYGDSPNLVQTSTAITFDNGFTPEVLMLK